MANQPDGTAEQKERAARHAAGLVTDSMVVGLGSGSTATLLVQALGARLREGLRFTGVSTSEATAVLARSLGIPLATLEERPHLDMTIDGADEVDPQLNLIKGRGGALLREKIVASAAARLVIVVDASKLVARLGARFPIPVEVVPFGWVQTGHALERLGAEVVRRSAGSDPFLTDGGHYVLDSRFPSIDDPHRLGDQIKAITGVVDHGLFLGMADTVIVGHADRVETRTR